MVFVNWEHKENVLLYVCITSDDLYLHQKFMFACSTFSIQKDSELGYGCIVLDNLDTTCDPIYNGLV